MWMSILLAYISHEAMNEGPEFPWSWEEDGFEFVNSVPLRMQM